MLSSCIEFAAKFSCGTQTDDRFTIYVDQIDNIFWKLASQKLVLDIDQDMQTSLLLWIENESGLLHHRTWYHTCRLFLYCEVIGPRKKIVENILQF